MKWRALTVICGIFLLLSPGVVAAQEPGAEDVTDVLIRIGGPHRVAPGERVKTLVVIGDDAMVEGTVAEQLVVIDGTATISGTVEGNVAVISGKLVLNPGAHVGKDVNLVRSNLTRAPDSTVSGMVRERNGFSFSWGFWWLFWLSMTVAMVASGLLFAAVGGRQLAGAAGLITNRPGETILTTVVMWAVLPFLAVLAFITLLGIPFSFGILFFLMPALWFIGYLVAGAGLGMAVGKPINMRDGGEHPYLATILGLVILQAIGFIPWFGGIVVFFAGLVGAGALVYRSWRAWRGTAAPRPMAAPAT